nr:MAG TPA: hypothetical protein [Caudoviricetes sp.]
MRGFYRDFCALNLLSRPIWCMIEIVRGTTPQTGR